MSTLNPEDEENIKRVVVDDVLAVTVCRLYFAEGKNWNFKFVGALVLTKNSKSICFFKLVELNPLRAVWEYQIPNSDIKYEADRNYFHSFLKNDCMTGFNFADENEAENFLKKFKSRNEHPVVSKSNSYTQLSNPPIISKSNSNVGLQDISRNSTISNSKTEKPEKKEKSIFGFKKKKEKKTKLDKSMIGNPTDFVHKSHVGYTPATGFKAENIPFEWKAVFARAGITEEQLSDKKTQKFVMNFMQENYNSSNAPAKNQVSSTSVSKPKRTPPPPPPSRKSASQTSRTHESGLHAVATKPPVPSYDNRPEFNDRPVPPPPVQSKGGPPQTPSKPANVNKKVSSGGPDTGDLLASIRNAGIASLKKVETPTDSPQSTIRNSPSAGGGIDDMATALAQALANRRAGVADTSDEEESDDEEWD
ncbi:hypothetical protein HK099_006375 [Clydaea vesicula]|uniref:Neural Wiskott-Aldrich syndrome protein n=1 Tax=Clydaea vesicula TaxID=447962 RepID=A0AAD5U193_9FUNG|nr:hypothetical protein HK099_006375 [Clydaea vesicula]